MVKYYPAPRPFATLRVTVVKALRVTEKTVRVTLVKALRVTEKTVRLIKDNNSL